MCDINAVIQGHDRTAAVSECIAGYVKDLRAAADEHGIDDTDINDVIDIAINCGYSIGYRAAIMDIVTRQSQSDTKRS